MNNGNQPLIHLDSVTKVFLTDEVETHALSGIHLDIRTGEYVSIAGPSGCGKSTLLSIPSSCLVGKPEKGKGSVYIVRAGRAHLTPVKIGADNGSQVGIAGGLKPDDQVIRRPGRQLRRGLLCQWHDPRCGAEENRRQVG